MITLAEIALSHGLGWYAYRLDNIPPWIPPAHGIVFLTALRAVDMPQVVDARPRLVGGRPPGGLLRAQPRPHRDQFGAALGLVFLAGMLVLPDEGKRFYASLGLVVAYLEIAGTALGTWTWAPQIGG